MTLDEIKTAVDAGKIVFHKTENFQVKKNDSNKYVIVCTTGELSSTSNLIWEEDGRLAGEEYDFYIKGSRHSANFMVGCDGDLVRVSDRSYAVVREKFEYHHREITNGKELCATLRAGPYAWPGGYPLFIGDSSGEVAHFECVKENLSSIIYDLRHTNRFGPMYCEINYENSDLYCDCCGKKIESAYGDDDEEE